MKGPDCTSERSYGRAFAPGSFGEAVRVTDILREETAGGALLLAAAVLALVWANALSWVDVLAVSLLAGIGFTVSLLIVDLAFGADTAAH